MIQSRGAVLANRERSWFPLKLGAAANLNLGVVAQGAGGSFEILSQQTEILLNL